MQMSGAKLVVEVLKQEGVEVIFGFPGGAVIPIFDELYSAPSLRVVLTRHEQGALHAADGYARSTGKVGVSIVTSGPGATNTITGLATANFDSVPIVCLTGQVKTSMIGNDAFQEADTVGVSRSVTKHNYLVSQRKDLGRVMKEAFHVASTGRPGPVLVDLPTDVLNTKAADKAPDNPTMRGYNPVTKGHPGQIRKAVAELRRAKKPLFYVGGGVQISDAQDVFVKIVEGAGVPVISSLMGIGSLPSEHRLNLGMLGMHGTYAANMAVSECDLLFAVGTRFDDRATGDLSKFAPFARIIHIDIDPAAIARNVPVAIPIVGDARLVLNEILPLIKPLSIDPWLRQVGEWQKAHPLSESLGQHRNNDASQANGQESQKDASRLSPTEVVAAISEVFPDAIITTEVGQNQMWAALYYKFKHPRTLLTSGGLGTMGYGFPAAIGAQIGNPDKRVIDIAGDGSIQMNIQELATAVSQRVPVIVCILNNGFLGMVRQWQELFYDRRYSSTCLMEDLSCPPGCNHPDGDCPIYSPDFVKLAEAYGALGIRVDENEEVRPALHRAAASEKPVIIDFLISREANVWPMVPPGAGLTEMVVEGGKQP
jgi:acetolactate synthase-1/2/3 large subunit